MTRGSPILTVRLDQQTINQLKYAAETLQKPVSFVVRYAIIEGLESLGLTAEGEEGKA